MLGNCCPSGIGGCRATVRARWRRRRLVGSFTPMPFSPTHSNLTPDKARGSATRSPDSSEGHPSAPRPANRTAGPHEPARPAADPRRVRTERDSRGERGGGQSQGERPSQRNPTAGAPRTATNTGGEPTRPGRR